MFTNTLGYYEQLTLLMRANTRCRVMRDMIAWYDSLSSLFNLVFPFVSGDVQETCGRALSLARGLLCSGACSGRGRTRETTQLRFVAENKAFMVLDQCERDLYVGMKRLLLQMRSEKRGDELFENLGVKG